MSDWSGYYYDEPEAVTRFVSLSEDATCAYWGQGVHNWDKWAYKARPTSNYYSADSAVAAAARSPNGAIAEEARSAIRNSGGQAEWLALDGVPREHIEWAAKIPESLEVNGVTFDWSETTVTEQRWSEFFNSGMEDSRLEISVLNHQEQVEYVFPPAEKQANPHFTAAEPHDVPTRDPFPINEASQRCPGRAVSDAVGCGLRREPSSAEELLD